MIFNFLQGLTLAIAASMTPGPLQAFLLSQAVKNGWKRTLPAALSPLISDGPIIALVLLILTQTPQWFLDGLRIVGGLFILIFATAGRIDPKINKILNGIAALGLLAFGLYQIISGVIA